MVLEFIRISPQKNRTLTISIYAWIPSRSMNMLIRYMSMLLSDEFVLSLSFIPRQLIGVVGIRVVSCALVLEGGGQWRGQCNIPEI
jgi:hypothetical protein